MASRWSPVAVSARVSGADTAVGVGRGAVLAVGRQVGEDDVGQLGGVGAQGVDDDERIEAP